MSETYTLELTKDDLLMLHGMCCNSSEFIIRDVSKLSQSEGTEQIRAFYVGMLKQHHELLAKIIEKLN
jgi:hypothetical protein